VNNKDQWEAFNNYIDTLISEHHRVMEQATTELIVYRAQGSIYTLRRLKLIRNEVNGNE